MRSLRLSFILLVLAFANAYLATSNSFAQDESLADLKQQWVDLNKQLDEKQTAYEDASPIDKKQTRDEYEELISSANDLVDKIKTAAVAEAASADEKKPVFETLVGIMINEANFGRDLEAFRLGQVLIEQGVSPEFFTVAQNVDRLNSSGKQIFEELSTQLAQATEELPQVKFETSKGDIVVELFEKEAPGTVGNFISLVENDFYDGLKFFQVVEDMGAVTGSPKNDGTGDAGYQIKCECYEDDARNHFAGALSMQHSGKPNTGGSQFMICTGGGRQNTLRNNKYTVFGRIVSGFDVVQKLQVVDPNLPNQPDSDLIVAAEVIRKTEGKTYEPNKAGSSDENANDEKTDGDSPEATESDSDKDAESEDGGEGETESADETEKSDDKEEDKEEDKKDDKDKEESDG